MSSPLLSAAHTLRHTYALETLLYARKRMHVDATDQRAVV